MISCFMAQWKLSFFESPQEILEVSHKVDLSPLYGVRIILNWILTIGEDGTFSA